MKTKLTAVATGPGAVPSNETYRLVAEALADSGKWSDQKVRFDLDAAHTSDIAWSDGA